MRKRSLAMGIALLLVLSLVITGCSSQSAGTSDKPKTQFLSIATASMGGSYYPIGVGMSQIFTAKIPGVEPKVEVTGGATENPKLVGAGDSDLGFTNANLAYAAYKGAKPFDKPYDKLRMMFSGVAPGTFHIAVRADSSIQTYADLKGKKVAVGPQGGGGLSIMPDILGMFNLKMDDLKTSYMSYDEGIQALNDKQIDAALVQAPHPAPAIKTLQGSQTKFRLIELTDSERDALVSKYPYYNKVDIPADVYGLGKVVKTIGSSNVVVVNADLSEQLVYDMTKAIFENLDELHKVHPSANSIKLDSAVSTLIPLHPGAEKYFKEVGAIK